MHRVQLGADVQVSGCLHGEEERLEDSAHMVVQMWPVELTTCWSWTPRSTSSSDALVTIAGWTMWSRKTRWFTTSGFPGMGKPQIYAGYAQSFAVSEEGGVFFWEATNTSHESIMHLKAVLTLCGWGTWSLAHGKRIVVAVDHLGLVPELW